MTLSEICLSFFTEHTALGCFEFKCLNLADKLSDLSMFGIQLILNTNDLVVTVVNLQVQIEYSILPLSLQFTDALRTFRLYRID